MADQPDTVDSVEPSAAEMRELLASLPHVVHADCAWQQIGPCVYCTDHDERLYHGSLPVAKGGTPPCEQHDWDEEFGLGFYFLCKRCGTKEWPDD